MFALSNYKTGAKLCIRSARSFGMKPTALDHFRPWLSRGSHRAWREQLPSRSALAL